MSVIATYLYAGLALQLLFVAWSLYTSLKERSAAEAFTRQASDPTAAERASERFVRSLRSIGQTLATEVDKESTLDEALIRAVVRTNNEALAPPLGMQIVLHAVLVFSAFAPFFVAALAGASQLVELANHSAPNSASAYVLLGPRIDGLFELVREGTLATGWLLANLALLWALIWWLRRPEVREARFVRALLEASSRMRPNAKAPISKRFADIVSPATGLARPAFATGLWFVAIFTAWGLLMVTAPVRANRAEPKFDVLANSEAVRLTPPGGIKVPDGRGGATLKNDDAVTVSLGLDTIYMADQPVARLDGEGVWSWLQDELHVSGRRVLIMADRRLDMESVFDLMRRASQAGPSAFAWVAARTTQSGRPVNVVYPVSLKAGTPDAVRIDITPEGVLLGAKAVPFDDAGLRAAVRGHVGLTQRQVALVVDPDTSFQGVMSVVAAVDDPCISATDCGLPGLDFQFSLTPR